MRTISSGVPLAIMTYYNIVLRAGHRRMARTLAEAGIAGAILPDLPIDELDGWGDEAAAAGVETVLLVAPTTPNERLKAICARSRGFVYGVGVMGVTGERAALSASAPAVIRAIGLNHGRCAGAKKSAMKRPSNGTCRRNTTPKRRPRRHRAGTEGRAYRAMRASF